MLLVPFSLAFLVLSSGSATADTSRRIALSDDTSIAGIQLGYANGSFTVKEVVQFYLDRIQKYDKSGPKLNSVIETDPDIMAVAADMDETLQNCQASKNSTEQVLQCLTSQKGILFGIVTLVKDNIATKGKMQTTAGSLALIGSIVPDDAGVVKRLKSSGAIILGKAGMTEWANFRSDNFPDGWSGRGGQVLNPHDNSKTVGGSSSGCGSAVAAHLATICIGTETDGSIISPSYENKVPGLKPTPKTIPQDGIIPITLSEDVAGPIGRNMQDIVLVWSVLANKPWTSNNSSPITVGVMYLNNREETIQVLHKAPGIKIVPLNEIRISWVGFNLSDPHFYCRFRDDMNDYLSTLRNTSIRTLQDIVDFNNAHKKEERIDEFGQAAFYTALNASTPTFKTNPAYCADLESQYRFIGRHHPDYGFLTLKQKYGIDILIGESLPANGLASRAGYPAIHYPVGNVGIVGVAEREETLLAFGNALEKVGTRPIPRLY